MTHCTICPLSQGCIDYIPGAPCFAPGELLNEDDTRDN